LAGEQIHSQATHFCFRKTVGGRGKTVLSAPQEKFKYVILGEK
jgi:hypothetical protein